MIHYVSSGHFLSDGDWIHPERCMDTCEILFVLKGTVFLAEEENAWTLKRGDVLLLEPGRIHRGTQFSRDVEFYWLHFSGEESYAFKQFHPREQYEIISLMKRILHIANTPDYPADAVDAAVVMLVRELAYQNRHTDQLAENELSGRICEYVRIHAEQPLTVEQVALHFGYTKGYISKFFKSKYGVGLKGYIEAERMKKCKAKLLTTTAPVKEIAFCMGWENEKNFIKFFTYHEKISPARFRNLYFHTHQNAK